MAIYPGAIYTYINRTGTQTLAAGTHSTAHNEAAAEVIAIETELGVNPKGIYVDVGTRLDALAAAIGAQHTQNTDIGTSSDTFYLDGASGALIKEVGGAFAVRNNLDNAYVDFACAELTCEDLNGITALELAGMYTDWHSHANKLLLDSYTQLEIDLADAVLKKHTQHTDTGTIYETFQLNSVNPLSARYKVDDENPTRCEIVNAADDAYAPIRALEFQGDLTARNADINLPRIRYNDITDRWQMSNDGLTFVDISQGISMAGGPGTVQFNDTTNLGADALFWYDNALDTLYVPNLNVSGVIIGAVGTNITGTTADTFEINTDGNGLLISTIGLLNDRTVLAEDVYQAAQNWHVAATVLDTASIDFSIVGQQISGAVLPAGVDHDALLNFVANEHINHTAVTITAGTGLTGGGDISANRTISLSHLGLQTLADPNADRVMFWDDSAGNLEWLTIGAGLTITGTTLDCTVTANTVADTASIDLTLLAGQISGVVLPAGVDHDSLNNFVANEHVDHSTIDITAGTGLTGGGDLTADRTISLSHLGIQSLVDPNANRLMAWDDTDGSVQWVTIGSNLTYTQATHTLSATGGATLTRATFVNGDLAAGVLTITHSAGLAAPYSVMVVIFDNNNRQIIPDEVTGATNSVAVDLTSYGTLTGTWGYGYIA